MNVKNTLNLYSQEKQNRLKEELKGFWKEDLWNINNAPINQEKRLHLIIKYLLNVNQTI